MLTIFAEQQVVAVEGVDAQTDVGEGLHAKIIFNECCVRLLLVDGRALNEQTVTFVLELGKDSLTIVVELRNSARETDIQHVVVSLQSPLSPQVASIATFLTRIEGRCKKEDV